MQKTNAARMLDQRKVGYKLISYEVDESELGAIHIADQLGQNIDQIFKTLVLRGNNTGVIICAIPGGNEINLKKLAAFTKNKKVEMVAMKELLPLTGYIRGGCSPLGLKKNYPIFIQESCLKFDFIYVSAGKRGLQIEIDPKDLVRVASASVGDFID